MTNLNGIATKESSPFRMTCAVGINIRAESERVWSLLTNAEDIPRWNTTVTRVDGNIALGERVEVRVPISERTFKLKVKEFEPGRRMVWSDGTPPMFKGERTFTLTPKPDGSTDFEMVEVFTGLMLPMIKGSLPDFGPPFEQYAADLKTESERSGS